MNTTCVHFASSTAGHTVTSTVCADVTLADIQTRCESVTLPGESFCVEIGEDDNDRRAEFFIEYGALVCAQDLSYDLTEGDGIPCTCLGSI